MQCRIALTVEYSHNSETGPAQVDSESTVTRTLTQLPQSPHADLPRLPQPKPTQALFILGWATAHKLIHWKVNLCNLGKMLWAVDQAKMLQAIQDAVALLVQHVPTPPQPTTATPFVDTPTTVTHDHAVHTETQIYMNSDFAHSVH